LRLHEILELTPRQVDSIYFHPREDDGRLKLDIVETDEPMSYEDAMLECDMFYANFAKIAKLTEQDYEKMKQKIKEKYGKKEETI
jgi:hypothetical protein